MTSWRDTTSQHAQEDLDGLLDAVLPSAQKTLVERGELLPFGAVVGVDGGIAMLADPCLGEHPSPVDVLEAVYAGARDEAGAGRAVAVVADVWTMGGDAVRVELEHRDGVSLVVLLPYKRAWLTRKLTIGEMSTATAPPRIWVGDAP